MTNIQAWAFLVGCNQYLDYRTIVAPDFMCESKTSSLLAKAAGGDLTEIGTAYYREIHNSKVGDLTLVFRVIEATSENTGIEGQGVLKDSFGREIYLIEGIVFKGLQPGIVDTQKIIEEVHQKMIVHYQDFWNTITSQPAIESQHFSLSTEPVTNICWLKILKPYLGNYIKEKTIDHNEVISQNVEKKQKWDSKTIQRPKLWNEISSIACLKNMIAIGCDKSIQIPFMSNDLVSEQSVIVSDFHNFQKYSEINHIFKGECLPSKFYHPTPVAISPDEQYIASAMIVTPEQNVVKLWEIETKQEILSFYGQLGWRARINAVAFVPNLPYLISGGQDLNIVIWDIKSNCQIKKIRTQNVIFSIAVSHTPLGKTIIACGQNKGRITAWNLENPWNLEYQDHIYQIRACKQQVNSLAFNPQGDILASGSQDKVIKLWNSTTGELISTLGYHLDSVNSIAFSPDGQMIASASDDRTIKIWDVYRGKEIAELKGHNKAVTSVSFSPDGRTLVSGSKDKTIIFWQR